MFIKNFLQFLFFMGVLHLSTPIEIQEADYHSQQNHEMDIYRLFEEYDDGDDEEYYNDDDDDDLTDDARLINDVEEFGRQKRSLDIEDRARWYRRRNRRRDLCKRRGGSCIQNHEVCNGLRMDKFCSNIYGSCCIRVMPEYNLTCGGAEIDMATAENITDLQGLIKSPSFPLLYQKNKHYAINIFAPDGYVIDFEWKAFDLEYDDFCGYDYVKITDYDAKVGFGKFDESKFCGIKEPYPLRSRTNKVKVQLITDYNIQRCGFALCYKAIPSVE